jgi:hypothetical protein
MRPLRIVIHTPLARPRPAWRFSLRCLVLGHEDSLQCVPGRMCLKCEGCGRETTGCRSVQPLVIPDASPRWSWQVVAIVDGGVALCRSGRNPRGDYPANPAHANPWPIQCPRF